MSKSAVFLWFFQKYLHRRLSNTFSDIRLYGSDLLVEACRQEGALIASNHVAWWDPLLLMQLESRMGINGYCLMDADNLRQLSFFRWAGALPLDRSSRRLAYRDLMTATKVLNSERTLLAIFAQGEQRPAHLPLEFKPGVGVAAARCGKAVVPLALRYDFGEGPRATVRLSVGEMISPEGTASEITARVQEAVRQQLDRIDSIILHGEEPYLSLLGRRGDVEAKERLNVGARLLSLGKSGEKS